MMGGVPKVLECVQMVLKWHLNGVFNKNYGAL